MRPLLDHRLIVIAGKGGVGRTTATAALGLAAARLGKRVCVVELSGQSSLARTLGLPEGRYQPREVAPRLDVMSLSAPGAVSDFGQRKLGIGALARWFFESRLMAGFIEAVPGLVDVVQLGKVENMLSDPLPDETSYDLVVLDAPATGHGLTLLAAARAMRDMTGVGPFHDLADIIATFLADERLTATALITLPESLPVNEGLELSAALRDQHTPPTHAWVNQVAPAWPQDVSTERVLELLDARPEDARQLQAREVLTHVATDEIRRHEGQEAVMDDLRRRLPEAAGRPVPVFSLPLLEHPEDLEPLVLAMLDVLEVL